MASVVWVITNVVANGALISFQVLKCILIDPASVFPVSPCESMESL